MSAANASAESSSLKGNAPSRKKISLKRLNNVGIQVCVHSCKKSAIDACSIRLTCP